VELLFLSGLRYICKTQERKNIRKKSDTQEVKELKLACSGKVEIEV
jgi:hypothetical protein